MVHEKFVEIHEKFVEIHEKFVDRRDSTARRWRIKFPFHNFKYHVFQSFRCILKDFFCVV